MGEAIFYFLGPDISNFDSQILRLVLIIIHYFEN